MAYLAIPADESQIIYVRQSMSPKTVRHAAWLGRGVPYKGTAIGAAMAGEVGERGFAFTRRTLEPDVTAIAAPIRGPRWLIVAAINVVGPTYRITDADIERFGTATVEAAHAISREIGAASPAPGAREIRLITMPVQSPEGTQATFLGAPLISDLAQVAADFAVIGVPFGVPYGKHQAHYGPTDAPRAVRERSLRYGRMLDHYDFDFGSTFSDLRLRIVDCGDVVGDTHDVEANVRNAVAAIRQVSSRGAVPIVLGATISVSALAIRALDQRAPLTVVQIDAHIDYRDEVNGEKNGYSSPMRRAAELNFVDRVIHIGSRGVGSARPQDVADTLERGNRIVTAAAVREHGFTHALERIPAGGNYHIVLDCDGLDPAVMPGTSAPVPGGLAYDDVAALFRELGKRGRIAGFNLAEHYPALDVNGITALTAVRLIVNLMAGTRIGSRTSAALHERTG